MSTPGTTESAVPARSAPADPRARRELADILRDDEQLLPAMFAELRTHHPQVCALNAWEYMKAVSGAYFSRAADADGFTFNAHIPACEKPTPAEEQKVRTLLARGKWTLRHYTGAAQPTHTEIKSAFDIVDHGLRATAHQADAHPAGLTRDNDWKVLGNVKFVFTMFAVDGRPAKGRLTGFTHYTEYEPAEIHDAWVSKDYFDEFGRYDSCKQVREFFTTATETTPNLLARGSGDQLVEATALYLIRHRHLSEHADPVTVVGALDASWFGQCLEVKVPGPLRVNGWHPEPPPPVSGNATAGVA